MSRRLVEIVVLFTVLAAVGCTDDSEPAADDTIRMNEIQVLGSHNSYHAGVPDDLLALLSQFDQGLAESLDYRHPPLREQLDAGIRQLELDVFADPEGGLYATRHALSLLEQPIETGIAALAEPGFKVLHVQEIDFESTCLTFVACLREVQAWSNGVGDHLPVVILVEAKDSPIPDPVNLGFVTPHPIGAVELDALDAEIRSVFDGEDLITPSSLVDGKWPTLADARGKVLFALDNDDLAETYRGEVIFTRADPDADTPGFIKLNDPVADGALIKELVRRGFLVRTRADADTVQARTNDTAMRDAALSSGAQLVSTDYWVADDRFSGYSVSLPGDVAVRCNPVSAPPSCEDAQLKA